MTQILSYNIYRTENIIVLGKPYTVRFTSTPDGQDHALMVSNDATNQQGKYHFSAEVANDYKQQHDEDLANEVLNIIKDDLENNRI